RLHADTRVDEELGELAVPRVGHPPEYKTYVLVCKMRPCRRSARPRRRGAPPRRAPRHGYEGATVVRLEREIGLSRGAIFNWFPSKQELFLALAAEDNERLLNLFAGGGFDAL